MIAEEVTEVDPQLVVRGRDGEIMAVHYEQINNMLLNEFLKAHKRVEQLEATVAELSSRLEGVAAQIEMNDSAARVAVSSQ